VKVAACLLLVLLAGCVFVFPATVDAQDTIWIEDFGICNSSTIQIPVWSYNETALLSTMGLNLAFDDSLLTFVDITAGISIADWPTLTCTESAPGDLTIYGTTGGTGTAVPQYTEDVLFYVNFTCTSCTAGDTSTFLFSLLTDDLVGYTTTDGSFTWYDNCGLSVSSASGCINPVQITVSLSNTNPVDSIHLTLDYDTSMLEYVSAAPTDLTSDWIFITGFEVTGSEGVIVIAGSTAYGGTPIAPASSGDLVDLTFNVTCSGCVEDATSSLTVSSTGEDLAYYTTSDGLFTYHCGTPGPAAIIVGDGSGLHLDIVTIPVLFDNSPNDVDAFLFDLIYDSDALTFNDFSRGDLTAGFSESNVGANVTSTGVLTIGGYDTTAIPAGSTGTLIFLEFEVNCSSCSPYETSNLEATNLQDDLLNWETDNGTFTFLPPPPIPSMGFWGIGLLLIGISVLTGNKRKR